MSLDDLFDKFEKDELSDATHLTPREFAKLEGMAPQMVYYWIRNGVIEVERCRCGRKVVAVEASRKALQAHKETSGGGLPSTDTGDTTDGQ